MTVTQSIIDAAMAGEVICSIGQIDEPTKRALDKLVKAGTLIKWKGKWFPVAGASYGIGPLKQCWGLPSVFSVDSQQ